MCAQRNDNTATQITPTQQKLLDLVDRVSDILESADTPQITAQKLMADYGSDALDLARACAQSFPGKRNSNKQAYWETVRDVIEKSTSTTH